MKIIKKCTCCHKDFEAKKAKAYQRIVCKDCAKQIKREVYRRRMKEFPISFWNWNITTNNEVDEIIKDLQTKMSTTASEY